MKIKCKICEKEFEATDPSDIIERKCMDCMGDKYQKWELVTSTSIPALSNTGPRITKTPDIIIEKNQRQQDANGLTDMMPELREKIRKELVAELMAASINPFNGIRKKVELMTELFHGSETAEAMNKQAAKEALVCLDHIERVLLKEDFASSAEVFLREKGLRSDGKFLSFDFPIGNDKTVKSTREKKEIKENNFIDYKEEV